MMTRIFLIGYMGSGKTTYGKQIAQRMNWQFLDLDHYIESRHRKTIERLFEEKGEAGFREIEHQLLNEIADFENVVIATGGGAPCFFDNMELMNRKGLTVFFDLQPEELLGNLRMSNVKRPLIQGKSDEELLRLIPQMLENRNPYYKKAKLHVNPNKEPIGNIIGKIKNKLN